MNNQSTPINAGGKESKPINESGARWVKSSERLPDIRECEIVYREKEGAMFVLYLKWDTKLKADNYFYEWLEEYSQPSELNAVNINAMKDFSNPENFERAINKKLNAVRSKEDWANEAKTILETAYIKLSSLLRKTEGYPTDSTLNLIETFLKKEPPSQPQEQGDAVEWIEL